MEGLVRGFRGEEEDFVGNPHLDSPMMGVVDGMPGSVRIVRDKRRVETIVRDEGQMLLKTFGIETSRRINPGDLFVAEEGSEPAASPRLRATANQ